MDEQLPAKTPTRKSLMRARIAASISLFALVIGWIFLREEFYGSQPAGPTLVALMFGAWAFGVIASALALYFAYDTGVDVETRVIITDMALAGVLLNALSIVLLLLLLHELGLVQTNY
jgi:hypothetical protein